MYLLQCTLYWSTPGATPPSPPSSPEKEDAETKNSHEVSQDGDNGQSVGQAAASGLASAQDPAKTIQALLHHRIQQMQQNNKQNFLLRNVRI